MPTIDSKISTQTVANPPTTDLDAANLQAAGPAGQDIFRERVQVAGALLAEISAVKNVDPGKNAYGLTTRDVPERATAGVPVAIIVSNVAILLIAANTSRRSLVITNNGTSNIFIGGDNTVAASGAAMGALLQPGGTYTDSGVDLYNGDVYAIGSAAAAAQNISVWERT